MKQEAYLFVILVIVFFLSVSFANMHPTSSDEELTSSATNNEPDKRISTPVKADRGRLLYENHCTDCHNQYVHSRTSKKVNSIHDIRKWVIRWSGNLGLDWKEGDIEMVTDYLNHQFYQFSK